MTVLLEVVDLVKHFPVSSVGLFRASKGFVHAIDGVSFEVDKGETLSLVGESGCGKTTTGKCVVRLIEPTSGKILLDGQNLLDFDPKAMKPIRRKMQIVFQDPFASLNPRRTIRQILSQPFELHEQLGGGEIEDRVLRLLETVGLTPPEFHIDKFPHEFSGGQRQRLCIARAIALNPEFIVLDEPVSSLDMSVRGQILILLNDLQSKFNIAYLFITHDLAVVRNVSHRVAVMYLGEIAEEGPVESLYANRFHPYTKALLAATPIPNPRVSRSREKVSLIGEVPSPISPPPGCRFSTRCLHVMDICRRKAPVLTEVAHDHRVACYLYKAG
jgi:oligopeptide/dipeptide ABC transporter ATP-binding protein